jgi:hypothetical protein
MSCVVGRLRRTTAVLLFLADRVVTAVLWTEPPVVGRRCCSP